MAKTAVFGAAANQGLQYANPGRAAKSAVKAANRVTCVVNLATVHQADLKPFGDLYGQAAQILATTLETIRVALRQEITEGTADYSTIATAISEAAEQAAATPKASNTERNSAMIARAAGERNAASRKVADEAFAKLKKGAPLCAAKN